MFLSAVPCYPLTFNSSASPDCTHAEQFDVTSQMIWRNALFVHQVDGEVFFVVVGKDGRDNGVPIAEKVLGFQDTQEIGAR